MRTSIPPRFSAVRTLKEDIVSKTFLVSDHLLERENVVVKITSKDCITPAQLFDQLSWFMGIQHPQLVPILDTGVTKNLHHVFCVREYLPDSELLNSDPSRLIAPLISAVDFLRLHGCVHGAIKASNVFVADNRVRLADPNLLGTCHVDTGDAIHYRAPELFRGDLATLETDLYALGAVLYRILTGRHLFEDSDANRLRSKYLSASPQPAAFLAPVPQLVPALILELLSGEPARRTVAFDKLKQILSIPPIPADRAPFVGRQDVQDRLFKDLHQPSTGVSAIMIHGEAGIGKSRILRQLQLYCSLNETVFLMVQYKSGDNELILIERMVHSLVSSGHISTEDREVFRSILDPVVLFDRYPKEKITSDFVGLVTSVARRASVVLALDDVDLASADDSFLKQLAFRASEIPVRLVLTMKPSVKQPPSIALMSSCVGTGFVPIRLSRLAATEATQMIRYFETDDSKQIQALQSSAGNPLFIKVWAASGGGLDSPPEIKDNTQRFLAERSFEELRTLEGLAIFHKPIAKFVLASVLGISDSILEQTLNGLLEAGIVERHGAMFGIVYPFLQTAIRDSMSKERKIDLNRLAFNALQSLGVGNETLSHHAFEANLLREAAYLCRDVAREACERRESDRTIVYYERAKQCDLERNIMLPADYIQLASCYRWVGQQRLATELLRNLLATPAIHKESELLADVYTELTFAWDSTSIDARFAFIKEAIRYTAPDSPKRVRRYHQLFVLVMRKGDFSRAREVLNELEKCAQADPTGEALFTLSKGSLAYATGNFTDAINSFRSAIPEGTEQAPYGVQPSAVLNNIAVTFERLGDLKSAVQTMSRAVAISIEKAQKPLRTLLLGNLASMKVKAGAMDEAPKLFAEAYANYTELMDAGEKLDKDQFFFALEIDSILYALQVGDYQNAAGRLSRVKVSLGPVVHTERLEFDIARCKFFSEIGLLEKAAAILRAIDLTKFGHAKYFEIERALLESTLTQISPQNRIDSLMRAMLISQELGTVYQRCEIFISLARLHIELENKFAATDWAMRALDVISENGYGLFAPSALLASGLASEDGSDRLQYLTDAFQRASEMGLQELIAETAFHISQTHMHAGNVVTAREYLIRSTSLTARLAGTVPAYARKRYLAKKWRREALTALERSSETIPLSGSIQFATDADKYFAGIYRFTTASNGATSLDELLISIEEILNTSLDRSAVIMIDRSVPVRTKTTPELAQRIEKFRVMAKNRIYFESLDTKGRTAAGWIPINSETHRGGIYVMAQGHEPAFNEKEMELLTMIGNIASSALRRIESQQAVQTAPQEIPEFHGIIGASKKINEVYSHIQMAATNTATVLLEGESGTGKELVAKAIHAAGPRAKMPFIAVDCGAIPETLIEAELFGAQKGSYTGATADRVGLFESANHGTIFLDEISNTPTALQAKLLRVIQEREVRRIGETKGRAIDVRLIVASNQNLETLVDAGQFRKDLLYRLKVLHIKLPPLRDRTEDIPMLAHSFLKRLNASNQTRKYFAQGVLEQVSKHPFPGNVRELQHAVERAYFLTNGFLITDVHLDATAIGNDAAAKDEIQSWFKDISEGRKDFWSAIHNRYKRRDISREKVLALVDFGLRSTGGSYKTMASMFRMKEDDYRRFMDFLRRNDCLLDFRPYRKAAASTSRES